MQIYVYLPSVPSLKREASNLSAAYYNLEMLETLGKQRRHAYKRCRNNQRFTKQLIFLEIYVLVAITHTKPTFRTTLHAHNHEGCVSSE